MRVFAPIFHSPVFKSYWSTLALLFVLALASPSAQAQSLGYEGPTGIFVTPLASTAASPDKGLGKPVVGYHFIAGGNGLGDYQTVSVTEGFAKRYEFGYTSEFHAGSNQLPTVTGYNYQGFQIVHGKANLITSKTFGAISVGAIYRFNDNQLFDGTPAGALYTGSPAQTTSNADFYVVGTKVFTGIKKVPILFNAGLRGTNASLWGLAGNAPGYSARGFGALAFIFTLPNKSTLILGSEASQQPQRIKEGGLAVLDVPTSVVYAVRFVPSPKHKLNIDAGVLHATSGNDLTDYLANAKDRAAFGLSYAF
ncbi:MAG TPA: DUF3034 family protein [Terracidiphilus sp.]|nr:DUF3034 family protein [Terracidiphilus sp.]